MSDKRVLAMVKSVAAELEDEQGDAAMSGNVENLDVELDFVSKDSEAYVDLYILFLPTSQPSEDARLARRQRIVPREECSMQKNSRTTCKV